MLDYDCFSTHVKNEIPRKYKHYFKRKCNKYFIIFLTLTIIIIFLQCIIKEFKINTKLVQKIKQYNLKKKIMSTLAYHRHGLLSKQIGSEKK